MSSSPRPSQQPSASLIPVPVIIPADVSYDLVTPNVILISNTDGTFRVKSKSANACVLMDPTGQLIANKIKYVNCDIVNGAVSGTWMPIPFSVNQWSIIGGANNNNAGTFCYFPNQTRVQDTSGLCNHTTENSFSTDNASGDVLSLSNTLDLIYKKQCSTTGGFTTANLDQTTPQGKLTTLFCKNYYDNRILGSTINESGESVSAADGANPIINASFLYLLWLHYKYIIILSIIFLLLLIGILIYYFYSRKKDNEAVQQRRRFYNVLRYNETLSKPVIEATLI
jgi:hypothetical protein